MLNPGVLTLLFWRDPFKEETAKTSRIQTNFLILKRSSEITLWDLPLVLHLYRLQKGVAWKCCRVGWVAHQWIQYLYSLSQLSVGPGAYGNPPVKRVLVKSSPGNIWWLKTTCLRIIFHENGCIIYVVILNISTNVVYIKTRCRLSIIKSVLRLFVHFKIL